MVKDLVETAGGLKRRIKWNSAEKEQRKSPFSFERTGASVVAIVEIERNDHSLAAVYISASKQELM
ncbi:hypothetical protein CTT30_11185 [Vibrio coralliilyticus]|nr:hypothetical protein CTT30_11185 [Vibrio coralliilyticus]